MKLAYCAQMKRIDHIAIHERGIPSLQLMERAAGHVTQTVTSLVKGAPSPIVVVMCGTGNNGGDGLAVARQLIQSGIRSEVLLVGDPAHLTEDAREMGKQLQSVGGRVHLYSGGAIPKVSCIVDALFGVGLNREVEGIYRSAIEAINASACPVVSCDIPSGVNGDNGRIMGVAVKADWTVTFTCAKPGLIKGDGADCTGKLILGDIGIPADLLPREDAIPRGRYRHFKGNQYEVLGTVRHSETGEMMVLYRAMYGNYDMWARPAAMWFSPIRRTNYTFPRFTPLGNISNETDFG